MDHRNYRAGALSGHEQIQTLPTSNTYLSLELLEAGVGGAHRVGPLRDQDEDAPLGI